MPLDGHGFPPDPPFSPVELLYFRSWTATTLAKILYYCSFFFVAIWFITVIVQETKALGAWGFFFGLFLGLLTAVTGILTTRIMAEVVLSIFVIRENSYQNRQGGMGVAPAATLTYASV